MYRFAIFIMCFYCAAIISPANLAMLRGKPIPCSSDEDCSGTLQICMEHITECDLKKFCVSPPTSIGTCDGLECALEYKCRSCTTQEVTAGTCSKDVVCFNNTIPTSCSDIVCAAPQRCITEHFGRHRRCIKCPCPTQIVKCEQECSKNSDCPKGQVCEVRNNPKRRTTPDFWAEKKICYPSSGTSEESVN